VADSEVLHPQIVHSHEMFPKSLGAEEVRVSFKGKNDVIRGNFRQDPHLLSPHAEPV